MKNLTWQNPEQLFVAQELINKVKSKCCGIKAKEVSDFRNVHFTEAINDSVRDSVQAMREQMFRENPTECAIFIGGMNGILDEYDMLKSIYPDAKYYAFASTGGASEKLYYKIGIENEMLELSYAYTSIFRELLLPFKTV